MCTTSLSLIDQLSPIERDPQMMFYLNQALKGRNVQEVLKNSEEAMIAFIESIPEEKITYRYGVNKWTVGEVLQHIISYEKIMTESALRIANKSIKNPFGTYTQSSTAQGVEGKSKSEILESFREARKETLKIFASFSDDELIKMGLHEWFPASPRSLVLCISGHQQHHFQVLRDKYLEE